MSLIFEDKFLTPYELNSEIPTDYYDFFATKLEIDLSKPMRQIATRGFGDLIAQLVYFHSLYKITGIRANIEFNFGKNVLIKYKSGSSIYDNFEYVLKHFDWDLDYTLNIDQDFYFDMQQMYKETSCLFSCILLKYGIILDQKYIEKYDGQNLFLAICPSGLWWEDNFLFSNMKKDPEYDVVIVVNKFDLERITELRNKRFISDDLIEEIKKYNKTKIVSYYTPLNEVIDSIKKAKYVLSYNGGYSYLAHLFNIPLIFVTEYSNNYSHIRHLHENFYFITEQQLKNKLKTLFKSDKLELDNNMRGKRKRYHKFMKGLGDSNLASKILEDGGSEWLFTGGSKKIINMINHRNNNR